MIVTFKPIVINKRKDGTWPVKIRVTFKGVSRRLPPPYPPPAPTSPAAGVSNPPTF